MLSIKLVFNHNVIFELINYLFIYLSIYLITYLLPDSISPWQGIKINYFIDFTRDFHISFSLVLSPKILTIHVLVGCLSSPCHGPCATRRVRYSDRRPWCSSILKTCLKSNSLTRCFMIVSIVFSLPLIYTVSNLIISLFCCFLNKLVIYLDFSYEYTSCLQ